MLAILLFMQMPFPSPGKDTGVTFQADNGRKYDLTFLPLSRENGYIVYATPSVSLLKMLNFTQRVLLADYPGTADFHSSLLAQPAAVYTGALKHPYPNHAGHPKRRYTDPGAAGIQNPGSK